MDSVAGYFDYAAATPLDAEVLTAMQPYLTGKFYNPSAQYDSARKVRSALEQARADVAEILGAKPLEIIFTAGATEANNLAIHGIMRHFPDANMVVSAIEHESVTAPAQQYEHTMLPVDERGIVKLEKLAEVVNDKTVLVSVMLANNEIGTVQPIARLAQELEHIKKARKAAGNGLPLLLHCDGAQAGNYLDLHVHRMGVDLFSLNGGKIYGPKQSGALYVRSGVILQPHMHGGGQERGLRSGTENVAAIIGFATALHRAQAIKHDERDRLQKLQQHCLSQLRDNIPGLTVNGSIKTRLPNNIHITIPRQDSERLIMLLDDAGYQVATGSACSASSEEPSHVLSALGMTDADIRSSLRITMGRGTMQDDIEGLVSSLVRILA